MSRIINDSDLDDAASRLGGAIPASLRTMYLAGDGWYNGEDAGEWWVIWPLSRVVDDNLTSWASSSLPRHLLAFGDDGAGGPFCMDLAAPTDEVVRWSYIDGEIEGSEGGLAEFLQRWCVGRVQAR